MSQIGTAKKEEVVIKVENVSKTFKIPHERHTSLKSAALNSLRKKNYTKFEAANDISFEVKKGEFLGIIGRNGSGKSTLLKMLAGIYAPTNGKITINGKLSPFLELGVGFNPELTARENVYLGGAILGLSHKEVEAKFDDIIRFAELEEFVDMKFKNFSSGMQVRLAFALSINAHAEILLMDEVLAVGDSNFRAKCMNEFLKYKKEGKTVLLVTHDSGAVTNYCDRAILLRDGKIIKIGKAIEVADRYVSENIKDDEIRLGKEEDIRKKQNKGGNTRDITADIENKKVKKTAEISGVKLFDIEGKEKLVFETGSAIDIMINYKIYREIQGFNIGVGLYNSEKDERVFSIDTHMDKFMIDKNKKSVILRIDNLPILKGNYYLNVACFGDTENTYYDIKQKYLDVKIFTKGRESEYRGICNIEHEWDLGE